MRSSDKPTYSFHSMYEECANSRRLPVRQNLIDKTAIIMSRAPMYEQAMNNIEGHLFEKLTNENISPLHLDDLKDLYDDKLLKLTNPRQFYDEMIANAKKSGCCFCTYNEPVEVDHFLPKTVFHEFSVFPPNLVPVCHDCNKAKGTHAPKQYSENFLHPYYERVQDTLDWLQGRLVLDNNSPTVLYNVKDGIGSEIQSRLNFQLKKLDLKGRYSLLAAREMSSREQRWRNIHALQGIEGVRKDLKEEGVSASFEKINSWKTAFYICVSQSDDFCEMGWEL